MISAFCQGFPGDFLKILLDTHCWLWWLTEPERMRAKARNAIADGDNDIFLSSVSSWEIAIKYSLGKLPLPAPPEKYVMSRLQTCGFETLAISQLHASRVASLPLHHRDPFDRLLVAQAQIEKMTIVSVDRMLKPYDVNVIWA